MDLGKHVYVQKPLTWSVEEARLLAKKAKDNKKIATYWGRWANSKGQVGPWSLPVSMTIAA